MGYLSVYGVLVGNAMRVAGVAVNMAGVAVRVARKQLAVGLARCCRPCHCCGCACECSVADISAGVCVCARVRVSPHVAGIFCVAAMVVGDSILVAVSDAGVARHRWARTWGSCHGRRLQG